MRLALAVLSILAAASVAYADPNYDRARQSVLGMAGCFLVDYSFAETEALKPGYILDSRVYDASSKVAVKELIVATEDPSLGHIRLQHVLFTTGADGRAKFVMKHQAEDWDYQPTHFYEFVGDARWEPRRLVMDSGSWVRRVTNLDDGLRYQCAAPWKFDAEYPEWKCDNYSPIPGREVRDMGRRDYQALHRSTRIIAFSNSWLERENNIKTIHQNGVRTPLAREVGKNWYVRQPDTACAEAAAWATTRAPFWNLLEGVWREYLIGDAPWTERPLVDGMPRYVRIGDVEDRLHGRIATDRGTAEAAKAEIREIIKRYRVQR